MPYTVKNPPAAFKDLPKHAIEIGVAAFNAAYDDTCADRNDREGCAFQVAWSAIEKKYKKAGDKWVSRAALAEVDLIITKASIQEDGTLRWQATASDTAPDAKDERTSMILFQDWIERATTNKTVEFLARAGILPRMPFLGLSHYPSLDGYGEAGLTERMFVDGNRFKADGHFLADDGHPLGPALFQAVRAELDLVKRGEALEKPIRISAAWWDLQHSHGDFVFTRRSLLDRCPMCDSGAGDKMYLRGQLDHFAATRVPINPRTALGLEEKSMAKITRRDDASSIVGDEQADALEERARQMVGKSETEEPPEGLVIKAEGDEEPNVQQAAMKTVDGEKFPASDFLVVEDPDKPSTWHLQVRRHGKVDHRLMGGAWAALYDPKGHRGEPYDGPMKAEAKRKLRALYKSEKMEPPAQKADVEQMYDEPVQGYAIGPFGGATSLDEAEAYLETRQLVDQVYTQWDMLNAVMMNILDMRPQEGELESDLNQRKLDAVREVASQFNEKVNTIKASVVDAYLVQPKSPPATAPVERSSEMTETQETVQAQEAQTATQPAQQPVAVQPAANDPLAVLGTAVRAALGACNLTRDGKVEAIQSALNTYTETVKAELDVVAPPPPGEEMAVTIATAVRESLGAIVQPLTEQLGLLNARLSSQPATAQPQQKSFAPGQHPPVLNTGGSGDQLPVSPITGQPSKLRALVQRSVQGGRVQ